MEPEEEESDDEDVSEDEDREWDDKCYICHKGGKMICCEGCSHVCHVGCLGLKKEPQGDWYCEDCLVK